MTAIAGDLDSPFLRAKPGFTQRVPCVVAVSWQPKVGLWRPSCFPFDRRRALAQKVDREVEHSATWDRLMKATAAQQSARRQTHHAESVSIPNTAHNSNISADEG